MEHCGEVVVCSPDLARSRGASRPVELIPNGVDVGLFRTARPRPPDLPPAPVALYVGTLHTWRIDIPLVIELAESLPDVEVVLVGPNNLPGEVSDQLERVPGIHILGARPYEQIPAYMQHADVIVIPHLVNPFTESLDPIKAYECLAAGRPTVSTPVAGFRELGPPIVIADRSRFVEATEAALATADTPGAGGTPGAPGRAPIPTWRDRAEAMAAVMGRVREEGRPR
jgi:glycosyltransferase involved in cell wall biosynthesis